MNEVLQRAIARINRDIEAAVKARDEKAVEELKIALDALEKQAEKKPIDSYNWEDLSEEERLETPRWYCKSCDGVIEEYYSYCALCSQAIDWSGDDE